MSHLSCTVSVPSQTLNILDCLAAYIQVEVEPNQSGFIPAEVEIKDSKLGNFFVRVEVDLNNQYFDRRNFSNMDLVQSRDKLDIQKFK